MLSVKFWKKNSKLFAKKKYQARAPALMIVIANSVFEEIPILFEMKPKFDQKLQN